MNALDLALANAAANAPKGEELHLENLDSIADPSNDEFVAFDAELKRTAPNRINPDHYRDAVIPKSPPSAVSREAAYRLSMEAKYSNPQASLINDPQQDGLLLVNIKTVVAKIDLINSRLDALADMITEISTTITTAAQSMPQSGYKHRSLHEWDDSTLLNELVERENDLMPFYYELLKRIGSPELQKLVMSSMQGKNASMVTLAQLCSALAPSSIQPQPQHYTDTRNLTQEETASVIQRMSQDPQFQPATVMQAPYPTRPQTYNPYSAS